jgi:HAE1 family hydrophobic/amphiphilic exporter-1
LARFFIDRPVFAIVISILMTISGFAALSSLPTAQYPDIVPPQIQVSTNYAGADAVTVEQSVATPIEQQVSGVDRMLYAESINANDGSMTLRVTFEVGSDVDIDQVLTQNRTSQAEATLPSEVKAYGLEIKRSTMSPLMLFSVYSPDQSRDALFISNYAKINLYDALLRVKGVGQITLFGSADYAMRIWLASDQLAKFGMTVADVADAIQRQNVVNPAGRVGGEPAPKGQLFTTTVRAQGRLETAEQFGDVIVRADPDGSLIRVRDVGRIELGAQNYNQIGRLDGKPAAIIALYQAPGANAIETVDNARALMQELSARFPTGLDYEVSLDTTEAVREGINEILHTLWEAMVLVLIVVFLFLQNWRATLIPLLAVPVSLVGTFVLFPMLGFSINTLSLFGLVLAIGLVVDDAIVVVEAVEHHIEHGLSPRDATIKAMDEVSSPVIGIAVILAAVFIPVAFIPGITGRLYQQFALTIAISVLISAFNALTLSPALSALLLRPRKPTSGPLGRFFAAFNRAFDRMTKGYVGWTQLMIRKSVRSVALLVAITVGAGGIASLLPSSFVPTEDQGYLFANVQIQDAASLQRADAMCRKVEEVLARTEGVEMYNTIAGYSLISQVSATYNGFFFITLEPWAKRPHLDAPTIVRNINRELAAIPDGIAFAFEPPAIPGIGTGGGFAIMLQDRSGGPVEFLAENVNRFVDAARQRPELASVITAFRAEVPQLFADVDKDKVSKQGVDLKDLYSALQTFLGGYYVNDFNRFGRIWKVYLQAEERDRSDAANVGQFYVRNGAGERVPLSTLVSLRRVNGPEFTVRFNLYRAAKVIGTPAPGYSSGQARDALRQVAAEVLPPEMSYAWTDMSFQEEAASGGAAAIFALSLVIVFLILAALYESWSLPWSVLLGTPIAAAGAFAGVLMRGFPNDVYVQIGMVMLIGLAAKNAILIVEFAKAERDKGRDLVEAAVDGARLRLRPILMTSFAFIMGCIPLWIASGSGAISRQELGTVVIVGMLAATLIGIFLVPVLFVVVERLIGSGRRAAAPTAAPATPPAHAEPAATE